MPISASASASRRFCPPESWRQRVRAASSSPTSVEQPRGVFRVGEEAGVEVQHFRRAQAGIDAVLLEHHADERLERGVALRVASEDADRPAIGAAIAFENLDGRRLARAVGAEQREDFSLRDAEADVLDSDLCLIDLAQPLDVNRVACGGSCGGPATGPGGLFHSDQFFFITHRDGRADGRPSCYDSGVIRPAQVDP